jgi:hypothetical protein
MKKIFLAGLLYAAMTSCSKDPSSTPSPANSTGPGLLGTSNSYTGGTRGGGGSNAGTGIDMGSLLDQEYVFSNASLDANWQGASKGFVGDVAINGNTASERTSGYVPYAGDIITNAPSLGAWQSIASSNTGQSNVWVGQGTYLAGLNNSLENVFTQINSLPVSTGFAGRSSSSLNGLNTQDGVPDIVVINIISGFKISSQINITGDANDVFILRWDRDQNFSNGYNGQVKFQSGGAIVPHGGLTPANFVSVAGDIGSSGGGSNPPPPYPQGPRLNNGTGALITGGQDFNGGGFFTGYWFTTGAPTIFTPGEQPYGATSDLSNAIFVGGWYSKTTKFSMTSGTSGVHLDPVLQ